MMNETTLTNTNEQGKEKVKSFIAASGVGIFMQD
jgi:hypothetical protein